MPHRHAAADARRSQEEVHCLGGQDDRDGVLVSEYPLDGLTAQDAQQLLGDEGIDRVMCLGRAVSGPALAAITAGRAITVDEAGYKYVLSPWADDGYRTPRGYFPPLG